MRRRSPDIAGDGIVVAEHEARAHLLDLFRFGPRRRARDRGRSHRGCHAGEASSFAARSAAGIDSSLFCFTLSSNICNQSSYSFERGMLFRHHFLVDVNVNPDKFFIFIIFWLALNGKRNRKPLDSKPR